MIAETKILRMINDDQKTLKFAYHRFGAFDYICTPLCENSQRACRIAESNFLTMDKVKLLELMGFSLNLVEDNILKTGD